MTENVPQFAESDAGLTALLERYLSARGLRMPEVVTGNKTVEEAKELAAAISTGSRTQILHEIADVALSAAVVAAHYEITVEECIALKTEFDRGRGDR